MFSIDCMMDKFVFKMVIYSQMMNYMLVLDFEDKRDCGNNEKQRSEIINIL